MSGRIDAAVERIKDLVTDGTLRPGDKLPIEGDLARQLGISKNSVREAVRALTTMNVLQTRQGDGTYVTNLRPERLLKSMSFVADLHNDETALDFFHVRRMLEPEATALAATRIGDEDLKRLSELLDEAEVLSADPESDHVRMVEIDHAFHTLIMDNCGNPVLAAVIANMSGNTIRARIWRGLEESGADRRTVAEHRAIYRALLDHDPDTARLRAAVHIAEVEDWMRAHLGRSVTTEAAEAELPQ